MTLCEQFAQNFAFVLTRLQLAIKLQAYGIAFVMPPWALFYATFIGSLRHALTPLSNTGMSEVTPAIQAMSWLISLHNKPIHYRPMLLPDGWLRSIHRLSGMTRIGFGFFSIGNFSLSGDIISCKGVCLHHTPL